MASTIGVHRRLITAVLGVGLVLALTMAGLPGRTAAAATASPGGPPVLPPVGTVYDNLSVSWWRYALDQPNPANPLLDPTGAGCGVGQTGPVFFLVGTAGGGHITRDDCVVPLGTFVYFPLVDAFDVHVPGDGLDTPELVWKDLHDTLGFRVDSLYATVDGKPVANLVPTTSPYRACAGPSTGCAPAFSFDLPTDNLFGLRPGTYQPAVADGFYLLLPPLTPGPHTITFGGTGHLQRPFSENVVYHLRIGS
jgi:hypothetical protein